MKLSTAITMACAALAAVTVPAYAAPWVRIESPHFVIYSNTDLQQRRGYAAKLEAFYQLTNAFYDEMSDTALPAYGKTRLTYFAEIQEFRQVRPELNGQGFFPALSCRDGTQYFSTASAQYNNFALSRAKIDPDIDLNLAYMFFAYNDHVLHERFSHLPDWARTGLNTYFMTAVFRDGKAITGKPMPGISIDGTLETESLTARKDIVPFSDLIAGKTVPREKIHLADYQDWIMVSYLMGDIGRRQAFFDYLKKVDAGMDSSTAFAQTIGGSPEKFRDVVKAYIDGIPTQSYRIDAVPDLDISTTPLPPGSNDLPLIDAALQTCPAKDLGLAHLATLRRMATRFPQDDMVQTALARAEIGFGDPAAALPYLSAQAAAKADRHDIRLLLGQAYLSMAEQQDGAERTAHYADARRELGKAYQLNPASAPGLYYYARAFADRPDYPNDNTLNAIGLAQDYSGGSYDTYQAELFVRRDRYDDARTLIGKALASPLTDKPDIPALKTLDQALTANMPIADILPLFARIEASGH